MTMKRKNPTYTEEQKTEFCEMAQYAGIGATIRELGYPTYTAAAYWMEQRGVKAKKVDIMAKAREFHAYYHVEDMLKVVDEAMNVVTELYSKCETADDANKLANAVSKLVTSRQLLEGKANSIVEKREVTQSDLEIIDLLNEQKMQNDAIEKQNNAHDAAEKENKAQIPEPKGK